VTDRWDYLAAGDALDTLESGRGGQANGALDVAGIAAQNAEVDLFAEEVVSVGAQAGLLAEAAGQVGPDAVAEASVLDALDDDGKVEVGAARVGAGAAVTLLDRSGGGDGGEGREGGDEGSGSVEEHLEDFLLWLPEADGNS
jgi:hypothetical protein